MLDTIDDKLTEDMIKKFHFILKDGTLTDSEKEWFNVGEYKKKKNFVGNITTSLQSNVASDMKDLLEWLDNLVILFDCWINALYYIPVIPFIYKLGTFFLRYKWFPNIIGDSYFKILKVSKLHQKRAFKMLYNQI